MGLNSQKSASLRDGLVSSAGAFALASVGFMASGVARNKASASWYGAEGLGLFAQVTVFQTLILTLSTAGIVTAARVVLTEPGLSPQDVGRRSSWLFWCPLIGASGISLMVVLCARPISTLLLGNSADTEPLIFAAASVPIAVGAQTAVAIAQSLGYRRQLVVSSAATLVVGPLGVVVLMSSKSYTIGGLSYLWAPAAQLALVLAFCTDIPKLLTTRPGLDRATVAFAAKLAAASFGLGLAATASDLFTRSLVVAGHGLAEVARFQVAAFISLQVFGILLSATATSILVKVRQVEDRDILVKDLSSVTLNLVAAWGIAATLIGLLAPILVPALFSSALVDAIPLLLLALAVEPLRTTAWCYGSILLPLGWTRTWMLLGISTVSVQCTVSSLLATSYGSFALALGYVIANVFNATATATLLRRSGVLVSLAPIGLSLFYFSILASWSWISSEGTHPVAAPILLSSLSIVFSASIYFRRQVAQIVSRQPSAEVSCDV